MGDRAMTEIKTKDGSIYFYSHWAGCDMPKIAKEALEKAQPRIGDDSYALKIVVDNLIDGVGARDKETGAGLMLGPDAEDEYNADQPSVIIDIPKNKITLLGRHTNA